MTETDLELALRVAAQAGRAIMAVRTERGPATTRAEHFALKDAGDRAAQDLIDAALRSARPDDEILSEEAVDDRVRLGARRVWIVDPLDGTSEFAYGDPNFAVQIALWEDGRFTVGVLDLPAIGQVLSTADQPGLHAVPKHRPVRIVVSRSRFPAGIDMVAKELGESLREAGITDQGAEVIQIGSVGGKIAHMLAGHCEVYWNPGGLNEWDAAAPAAVGLARGLRICHRDGRALVFNQDDTVMKGVVYGLPQVVDLMLPLL